MRTVEKILLIVLTIVGFIPLLWFCGVAIEQAIAEVDYLAVGILSILTLSLGVMGGIIIFESWRD